MSAKEILNKHIERYNAGVGNIIKDDHGYTVNENVISAMDEYAEQQSIAFNEFLKDNNYTKGEKGWYQYIQKREDFPEGFSMMSTAYEFVTILELYQLFLKEKPNP